LRAPIACLTRFAKRFSRDEGGSATVEAVIWIPFFFFILMLITDASLAFFARAQAFRAIEDGNRSFSVGSLSDRAATKSFIEARFDSLSPSATATVDYESTSRIITTQLKFPAREVVLFNTLGVMTGWEIEVSAQQYKEGVK